MARPFNKKRCGATTWRVRFFAGRGVGTATQPGLRVAVGEPAINPVPRQMMRQAVAEVLAEVQEEVLPPRNAKQALI